MTRGWKDYLPEYKDRPISPGYLADTRPISPVLLVFHETVGDRDDGSDAAALCVARSLANEAGVWHWTVGDDGTAWRHAPFGRYLSHAAGLNHLGPGIEFDKPDAGKFSDAAIETGARIAAAFCHRIGRAPSRHFLVNHGEDHQKTRIGENGSGWRLWPGTSTHTDGLAAADWAKMKAAIWATYRS